MDEWLKRIMMDEYITKENAQLARPEWRCRNDQYDCGWNDCINEYLDMIDTIPAEDVAPVIHGKWIRKRTVEHEGEWYCSICGKDMLYTWGPGCGLADYCPHCGARMDGK